MTHILTNSLFFYLSLSLTHTYSFSLIVSIFESLTHHIKRSDSTGHEEAGTEGGAKLSWETGWDCLRFDNNTL